ncbi:MAG: glycosyltransferase family 4 protein [Proteiniphilum sp.]|uniref:glycosyltransferase family 4 protein n=1 Tax=Proteiniphilum sp. TaxID=1926877 RepID=UPI000929FEA5|nr:glycosyltransferase family 4 protein [Proteiniphilum sp.]MEA5126985.1 glycosyltransferase family 4 protein [Proteiniphilum sp.]OJV81853.1 MAG: hypothetical protein BGO34_08750 [Bacteroidia bacterium 44-10]
MNKIYQLITSVQLGGAEIVAMDLAEHCGKDTDIKTEMTIVELFSTQNSYAVAKKKELASKNIRIITLYKGSKRMSLIFAPFSLIRLIKKERPFIIHSHTDLPDLVLSVTMRIARFFRFQFPQVARTIHNTQLWRTHHALGRITESVYGDESIVAVSSYAMNAYEELRKKYGLNISPNRTIIYNGCTVPQPCPHSFNINRERINIVFCGRFEEYKGMETLISAIPEIERRFPRHFQFHLIGDGSYKTQLQQLARENENVFLYDPISNVSTMFHAFDYLLMPSHFEGLGLISVEASFSGVPVIASFAPGLDETLPETWPLKFYLNNHDELYVIFGNIVHNRYEKSKLQKMAYDFVSKRFSQNRMIQSYNTLYNIIL